MPRLSLVAGLLALSASASAQELPAWAAPAAPDAPASDAALLPPDPPTEPTPVPLDGGLGLLALAGAGYAARRLRQRAS